MDDELAPLRVPFDPEVRAEFDAREQQQRDLEFYQQMTKAHR